MTISGAMARRPTSIGHSVTAWPCRFVWANYSGLSAETGRRRDLKHLFQQFQPFNRCAPFKPSEQKPFLSLRVTGAVTALAVDNGAISRRGSKETRKKRGREPYPNLQYE